MSRFCQKAIAAVFRILSKPIALLLAATLAAPTHATPAKAAVKPGNRTLSAFFHDLGRDVALKARFAQNPRGVLAEYGLDLADFSLPDRFTDIEIDRLLTQWPALIDPTPPAWLPSASKNVAEAEPPGQQQPPRIVIPTPVYGPPPGPRRDDIAKPPPGAPNPVQKNDGDPVQPPAIAPAPMDGPPSGQRR